MNIEDEIRENVLMQIKAAFLVNSNTHKPLPLIMSDLADRVMEITKAGYSSSQASSVPKKCNSKEHGLTGFYKNMQVSYCMDCEKVWQDDESASSQATPKPVEGDEESVIGDLKDKFRRGDVKNQQKAKFSVSEILGAISLAYYRGKQLPTPPQSVNT